MRRPIILVIALVFALALLARAVTYTVRFSEAGVLTTFGKAAHQDTASAAEPGLKFKWPDPIQSVTKYDTRTRFLQTKAEQQQTLDNKQITVEAFCTWRVADPLVFFQKFSNAGDRAEEHYAKAETSLRNNLRSAMGEVSRYGMADLFTTTPGASKLSELEGRVLRSLKGLSQDQAISAAAPGSGSMSQYGIEITSVGINRIELPEGNTQSVFETMKRDRANLVDALESRGDSEAEQIKSKATSNARRIEAFANAYAAEIRKQGDLEAQQYVSQMQENPELAVFLKSIEFLRDLAGSRITLVLTPQTPGMGVMAPPPATQNGHIPAGSSLIGEDLGQRGPAIAPLQTTAGNGGRP